MMRDGKDRLAIAYLREHGTVDTVDCMYSSIVAQVNLAISIAYPAIGYSHFTNWVLLEFCFIAYLTRESKLRR